MVTLQNIYTGQFVTTCALEAISMLHEGVWRLAKTDASS
jgi:hypothetical protein